MRHICTYFDINFLPRGMALLDSLENNCELFTLYLLALDLSTKEYFDSLNHGNVVVISLEEYIEYFNIDRSKYRDKKEFYFSVTPSICLYILKNYENIDLLLYLDADVYLFNDIEILYKEIGDASISMCSQRLPFYTSKKYGTYNVGINAFRNDNEGLQCLEDWHKDCTTWEPNQEGYPLSFFSDQIWLDSWPNRYKDIKIIDHVGIDTAPWNAIQYKYSKKESYYVDDVPLVIYHFSSLKSLGNNTWHVNTIFTIFHLKETLRDIYLEYIKNVIKYESKEQTQVVELQLDGNKLKVILFSTVKWLLKHKHTIKID